MRISSIPSFFLLESKVSHSVQSSAILMQGLICHTPVYYEKKPEAALRPYSDLGTIHV